MQRSISRPTPLSLFGFRASKTVTSPPPLDRRYERERERGRQATKETLIPLLPPSSPLRLPSRTLWCIGGRKTRTQAEAGSCIVLRFWFEPIVTNNGGHVRTGGGEAEDRWIRATIGIVDFVIRGFYEERVIERGRTRNENSALPRLRLLYCWIRNGFVLRGLIGGQIEDVELLSRWVGLDVG